MYAKFDMEAMLKTYKQLSTIIEELEMYGKLLICSCGAEKESVT